jgi:hypothetical protein
LTFLAGGGICTGAPKDAAPLVERLTKMVGTSPAGVIGIEEIIHVVCRAS